MEINVNRRDSNLRVPRTEGTPQKKETFRRTAKQDVAAWSRQAIDFIRRSQEEAMKQDREQENNPLFSDMEQEKKKLDTLQKLLRTQNLCNKIAASIMRGDRVPPEDLEYLVQHDIDGYRMALAMRKPKRNPEECKSVLTDEDKHPESVSGDGDHEAVSDNQSAAPAEGGDASGEITGHN